MADPRTTVHNIRTEWFPGSGVYVGRKMPGQEWRTGPTDGRYCNPFSRQRYGDEAGVRFVEYFLDRVERDATFRADVESLRGCPLFCWCHPKPCHAHVIAAWLEGGVTAVEPMRELAWWDRYSVEEQAPHTRIP